MELKELIEKLELNEEAKVEVEKLVQSETDKVRTDYSNKFKELEKYKPVEKTDEQIELDNAKTELAELKFKQSIKDKGLSEELANFLKTDADLDKVSTLFKPNVEENKGGYVPKGHNGNVGLTKEKFNKMTYSEKAKLYNENPSLYNELRGA